MLLRLEQSSEEIVESISDRGLILLPCELRPRLILAAESRRKATLAAAALGRLGIEHRNRKLRSSNRAIAAPAFDFDGHNAQMQRLFQGFCKRMKKVIFFKKNRCKNACIHLYFS